MLHDSILTVAVTIAAAVALVDMTPPINECVPQTGSVEFCLGVRELLLAFGIDQVVETFTRQIFAAHVAAVVFPALASDHKIFGHSLDSISENILRDELIV